MSHMQQFYHQLKNATPQGRGHLHYWQKLTQLQPKQITAMDSLLWWNSWGAISEPTAE